MPQSDGPGRLIAVEGIDGSGKSTVAREVARSLDARGADAVLVSRETVPDALDGYRAGHLRTLRGLIWEYPPTARTSELGFSHWAQLLGAWFAAVDHAVVRPALERGACVVADSWYYKFVARFAVAVGLHDAEQVFRGISVPDAVLWLDTPPEVCLRRRSDLRTTETGEWQRETGGADGFVAYQGAVRTMYRRLAAAHSWKVVGSVEAPSVAAELLLAVREVQRVAS
jgi:thymidylate kinase